MAHVAFQDTPKFAYLRNRPFLIIEMYKTVANPKAHDRTRTERKGWMADPRSIDVEEIPSVVDAVKDRHMRGASVIIDILRDCIVKNRLQESNEEVIEHFKRKYFSVIERGKNIYHQQAARAGNFDSFKETILKGHGAQQIRDVHTPEVARAVSRKV